MALAKLAEVIVGILSPKENGAAEAARERRVLRGLSNSCLSLESNNLVCIRPSGPNADLSSCAPVDALWLSWGQAFSPPPPFRRPLLHPPQRLRSKPRYFLSNPLQLVLAHSRLDLVDINSARPRRDRVPCCRARAAAARNPRRQQFRILFHEFAQIILNRTM